MSKVKLICSSIELIALSVYKILSCSKVITFSLQIEFQKKNMKNYFIFLLIISTKCRLALSELEIIREWKLLDFQFPNNELRRKLIRNQSFVAESNFPVDVDVHFRGL